MVRHNGGWAHRLRGRLWRLALAAAMTAAVCGTDLRAAEPAFACAAESPTAGPGLNRTWFAGGHWWAWLPEGETGSRVWKRSEDGRWSPQASLDGVLAELPGRGDVWCENFLVCAALTDGDRIALAALAPDESGEGYKAVIDPVVWRTAGRVADVHVSMDMNNNVWVLWSEDGDGGRAVRIRAVANSLSEPGTIVTLASGLSAGDACDLVRLNAGVVTMWSAAQRSEILMNRHPAKAPDTVWMEAETALSGASPADGHLHLLPFARPKGDMLRLIASFRGGDDGRVRLLLMKRQLEWSSASVAPPAEGETEEPTVVWTASGPALVYLDRTAGGGNALRSVRLDPAGFSVAGEEAVLIGPAPGLGSLIGPGSPPEDRPVLLLASDEQGNVYEAFIGP